MEKNQDNLDLLRKISKKPEVSQRTLANELGFSLGKLNYCLKALKKKGTYKDQKILKIIKKKLITFIFSPPKVLQKKVYSQ